MGELVQVTFVKSATGYPQRQKDTVRALGLRHIGDSAVHVDSPAVRGMIAAVEHLVDVAPLAEAEVTGTTKRLAEDDA